MWVIFFFFFNDPAPPEIYPLPLPAPLPILDRRDLHDVADLEAIGATRREDDRRKGDESSIGIQNRLQDRKSTRLNSSHSQISYAVFCLKKKTRCIACQFQTE